MSNSLKNTVPTAVS